MNIIAIGAASIGGLMLLLWLIHLPMHNAAIVDAGWAGGLALLAGIYAAFGGGYPPREAILAAMGGIWGLRLAFYLLFTRVIGHPEEGRYRELRRKWKTHLALKFLVFFEFQALLDVILSIPFLLAARNASPQFSPVEIAAVAVWAMAISGESAADWQLSAFKSNPANRGKTCRLGLWRYSRHPNYFFEWLIWISFALLAWPAPHGSIGMIAPALILFFLLRVTGIPATEEQAIRSRGDEYRNYQRTTSAFVPWFRKA